METFVYAIYGSGFLSSFRMSLNKILKVALGHCSCVPIWVNLQLGGNVQSSGMVYWKKSFLIKQSF